MTQLPNILTWSRLALSLVLFAVLSAGGRGMPAAALFVVAALTDALDGWIARRWNCITQLGRILDPFADKFLVLGTLLFLLARGNESGVTAWMVLVVLTRELLVTGLRSFLERSGHDFSADWTGKLKMALQSAALTAALATLEPAWRSAALVAARDVLLWATVAVTALSGGAYAWRGWRLRHAAADSAGQAAADARRLPVEKLGVILVDHGSRLKESNALLEQAAAALGARLAASAGGLVVEPAHMELAHPTIAEAYARCAERGAARVVVLPFFLAPGRHITHDIPALVAEAARRHPGVPHAIAAPLGKHDLMLELLEHRLKEAVAGLDPDRATRFTAP